LINLILFLRNIDALKRSESEHKLFLGQSTAQSLQVKTCIDAQYRMMKYEMKEI